MYRTGYSSLQNNQSEVVPEEVMASKIQESINEVAELHKKRKADEILRKKEENKRDRSKKADVKKLTEIQNKLVFDFNFCCVFYNFYDVEFIMLTDCMIIVSRMRMEMNHQYYRQSIKLCTKKGISLKK